MRRCLRWAWISALATAASVGPAVAQESRSILAVLPFENSGSYGQEKEIFEALELGIPAMLASELSRHPAVRLVEQERIGQVLKAQPLAPQTRVDAGMAAKIGQEAGARYVVMGSFVDFYGRLRINARVVDAGSGTILAVVSNDDPKLQERARLFQGIQAVRDKIVAAVGLPPIPDDVAAAGRARVVPTEALTAYSLGLLYERRGDGAKAAEHYRSALNASPDYVEAREGLQRGR